MPILIGTRRTLLGTPSFVPSDIPQSEADALIWLYDNTAGGSWTDNTNWKTDPVVNNWAGITVTAGHVTTIDVINNNLVGDISDWNMAALPSLAFLKFTTNPNLTGNINAWTFTLSLDQVYLGTTGLTADLSNWTINPGLLRLWINNSTGFSNAPDLSLSTNLKSFMYDNSALSQAHVDAVLLAVYNRRAAFLQTGLSLLIGGTNSTPSGTYQDGDPPTTGKEYAFELENDPESEGFTVWAITYTA